MRRAAVQLETRRAALAEEFGYDYAVRLFGQEAVDSVPTLKSGPNKGKPRGFLIWRKAMAGGYVRECQSPRAAGQLVDAWIGEGQYSNRDGAMIGHWYGRHQNLAGSYSVLGQGARDREAEQRARAAADWEIEKREMLGK